MIAGGISYYGVSDLMLLEGTMNEFSYAQAILYYKDNMDQFKKKNKNIIFEQDGASSHTSKSNKALLDKTFGKSGWIQNPPNSPDLAYPIETLWANLKKNVKRRDPKTKEDLKNICIEEWNKVNPKPYFKNFIKKIKKCVELEGGRLEDYYLKKMRIKKKKRGKRGREEEEKEEKEEEEEEEINNNKQLKRIFNDIILNKLRKKEISGLERRKKAISKKYTDKIKKIKEEKEEKEDDMIQFEKKWLTKNLIKNVRKKS